MIFEKDLASLVGFVEVVSVKLVKLFYWCSHPSAKSGGYEGHLCAFLCLPHFQAAAAYGRGERCRAATLSEKVWARHRLKVWRPLRSLLG